MAFESIDLKIDVGYHFNGQLRFKNWAVTFS